MTASLETLVVAAYVFADAMPIPRPGPPGKTTDSELVALADRLDDLGQPVSAAGILGVHRLLTQPDSVLYTRPSFDKQPRDVGAELGATIDRLEVHR